MQNQLIKSLPRLKSWNIGARQLSFSVIQQRAFSLTISSKEKSEQKTPSGPNSTKTQEDENLEFIIEQAYIKKKVEQAAISSQVKVALEKAKAKQRRKAHFVVLFGLFAAVAITLFVYFIHQQRSYGVQTETTKDRKF